MSYYLVCVSKKTFKVHLHVIQRTVARFGVVAPLLFRNCYQRVAIARLGFRVRVVGGISNKIMGFKTKCAMF